MMSEKKNILVIDDSGIALRNFKQLLEDEYSVAVANSGIHAITAIRMQKPDLILLDYQMPNLDGKSVFKMISEKSAWKDIPIVFLTSAADKEIVKELLLLKPAGYILKPSTREQLKNTIKKVIG